MKITKVLFTAAILVFAIALFSCDDGGGLGLLGAKGVNELKDLKFNGVPVKDAEEAVDLLDDILGYNYNTFISMLDKANDNAFNASLATNYSTTSLSNYLTGKSSETSITLKVPFDDTEKLRTEANVAEASIKGNSSWSYSSNRPYSVSPAGSYYPSFIEKDYYSKKSSFNKTFSIPKDFYTYTNTDFWSSNTAKYKVAGFVTVQRDYNYKTTLINKSDNIWESSDNTTDKMSATLIISKETTSSGTTKTIGGKFRISYSKGSSSSSRASSGKTEEICSDIEVYDNDNKLLFTIGDEGEFSFNNIVERFADF
jgi:hypothetical protein